MPLRLSVMEFSGASLGPFKLPNKTVIPKGLPVLS